MLTCVNMAMMGEATRENNGVGAMACCTVTALHSHGMHDLQSSTQDFNNFSGGRTLGLKQSDSASLWQGMLEF